MASMAGEVVVVATGVIAVVGADTGVGAVMGVEVDTAVVAMAAGVTTMTGAAMVVVVVGAMVAEVTMEGAAVMTTAVGERRSAGAVHHAAGAAPGAAAEAGKALLGVSGTSWKVGTGTSTWRMIRKHKQHLAVQVCS